MLITIIWFVPYAWGKNWRNFFGRGGRVEPKASEDKIIHFLLFAVSAILNELIEFLSH